MTLIIQTNLDDRMISKRYTEYEKYKIIEKTELLNLISFNSNEKKEDIEQPMRKKKWTKITNVISDGIRRD